MKITVEISLYPLDKEYKTQIKAFIRQMKTYENVSVNTTAMSTYVSGNYDDVMHLLQVELKAVYRSIPQSSTVIKIIPMDLNIEEGFIEI